MLQIPMDQVAFSIPDSFITLRRMDRARFSSELKDRQEGVYLRLVHGIGRPLCFQLIPLLNGTPCPYMVESLADCMVFFSGGRSLYVSFEDGDTLIVRGEGLGLRLDMPPAAYEYVARYTDNRCLIITSASRAQFMVSLLQGEMHLDAPYGKQCCDYIHCDLLPGADGVMRAAVELFETVWREREYICDMESSRARLRAEFDSFASRFPAPPSRLKDAMTLSLYVLWSCIVPPKGHLKRRGVLMSNSGMINVWTWDSAINAMGLSLGDPELALDQLLVPFDHQHETGLLPDYINPHDIMWNFTKPPVHGLALQTMLKEKTALHQALPLYEKFAKQADYWLTYADSDHDGIPQYGHGNDCGWDNCTPFEVGAPVEGPDLTAYLILQMESLARLARGLGRENEALQWKKKGEALLARLMEHSWDGERFQVYQSGTHRTNPNGDSLYPFLPLALGHRLPMPVFQKLVDGLKAENRFLTPYGLATESVSSPFYESDGYWRGPIWAPPMLFIIQGIADGGDIAFARLLADRFCDLMAKSGFAENFDALTGAPLRDPAYTWTASAFLILACRYATQDS
jgi:hypothetical protein